MQTSSDICVMQHPSSGMSVITNVSITKKLGMEKYPDWYYQKKAHKEDLWYKQLPSQTAQEVCKLLDKAWKSFYALKRSGGIEIPDRRGLNRKVSPLPICRWGLCMNGIQTKSVCPFQRH